MLYLQKTIGRVHRPKSYFVLDKSLLYFTIFVGNFFEDKRIHICDESGTVFNLISL